VDFEQAYDYVDRGTRHW